MKVKDLIDSLSELDPEVPVLLVDHEWDGYDELVSVTPKRVFYGEYRFGWFYEQTPRLIGRDVELTAIVLDRE